MKKFELTSDFKMYLGMKLFRIKALVDFGNVKAGDLGGYIEKEKNLSHNGNAWVSGNAQVYDNAWVYGDAQVYDNAWVYGDARVCGNAWVYDNAWVYGNAWVSGNARVYDNARVCGNAWVSGNARVYDNARVSGNADILQITGLGTEHRPTTVFRAEDGIKVACGCFLGDLGQFREQVKNTRTGKVQEEYLKFAELVEIYFGEEEKQDGRDEIQ